MSAAFEKGKKYALIGKSGSGKSTLIKLLVGYYPQHEGDIYTDENAVLPDDVAMIHQNTDVLLMDEATSALDEQTANAVERSILSLENVTCISVTHRLTPEAMKKYTAVFTMPFSYRV